MFRKPVVRVVQTRSSVNKGFTRLNNFEGGIISLHFLYILEEMGVIKQHEVDLYGLTELCFDINCPEGILELGLWAACTADKMRSLGFNAVVAPSTEI